MPTALNHVGHARLTRISKNLNFVNVFHFWMPPSPFLGMNIYRTGETSVS